MSYTRTAKYLLFMSLLPILITILAGCDRLSEPDRELVISVTDEKDAATVETVLNKRFGDYSQDLFASISSDVSSNQVTFTFRHGATLTFERGAPDNEVAEYLVTTPGVVVIKVGEDTMFSNADIIDVVVKRDESRGAKSMLLIELTHEAGQRNMEATRDARKKEIFAELSLDNKVLSSARVMETTGAKFQMGVGMPWIELAPLGRIMKNGALPDNVKIIKNEL